MENDAIFNDHEMCKNEENTKTIKDEQPWHLVSVSAKKPGYFCSSQ